ncbi:tyrosine-type recombinase/integrase [Cryobacterium zongtaii]|nr:site-specific integrase [Cryobacterium zongtaii]
MEQLPSTPLRSSTSRASIVSDAATLNEASSRSIAGVQTVLTALERFEGATWQARWDASGCSVAGTAWPHRLGSPWGASPTKKGADEAGLGIADLIAMDVIQPDYRWLREAAPRYQRIRQNRDPEFFARMAEHAHRTGVSQANFGNSIVLMTKVLAHTGLAVAQVRPEDFLEYRAFQLGRGQKPDGLTYTWSMLRELGVFDRTTSGLAQSIGRRRPTIVQMMDTYGIQNAPVRDMLARYLLTRAASLDYSTLRWLVYELAKNFWCDIEEHHPGAQSLNIGFDAGRAWLNRILEGPRVGKHRTLFAVRALYLDIASWATDDPYWAGWAAPSFLTREDTKGMTKQKRRAQAQMHQRIRDLAPILPRLLEGTATELKSAQALLAAATAAAPGEEFEHRGVTYLRHVLNRHSRSSLPGTVRVWVSGGAFERRVDITRREESCFWSWATINTLNETGVRIEELVEITTLALSIYKLPETGEALPLLQIVPSKTDRERVLLISPELTHVLALVRKRITDVGGRVPLTVRYDGAERVYSDPLPYLFQARHGSERRTMTPGNVRSLIVNAVVRAGIIDDAGQPYKFTPHDFRRLFATSALASGLPIHILAKLTGHQNIVTTQGYAAVYDEDTFRHFRSFLDRRRALRPSDDYSEPSRQEIDEFHQHFEKRKVELGTCGRAYGTPCVHEHACIRCPMLRPDPEQRPRLEELIEALDDRKREARNRGWLGELEGIEISLTAAQAKLRQMEQQVSLGIPTLRLS